VLTPAVGRTLWFLWHRKLGHIKLISVYFRTRIEKVIAVLMNNTVILSKTEQDSRTEQNSQMAGRLESLSLINIPTALFT